MIELKDGGKVPHVMISFLFIAMFKEERNINTVYNLTELHKLIKEMTKEEYFAFFDKYVDEFKATI